jgi:hypothetical protein
VAGAEANLNKEGKEGKEGKREKGKKGKREMGVWVVKGCGKDVVRMW